MCTFIDTGVFPTQRLSCLSTPLKHLVAFSHGCQRGELEDLQSSRLLHPGCSLLAAHPEKYQNTHSSGRVKATANARNANTTRT